MDFVDTSVLVRYLTGHPADQAQCAARLIDGAQVVWIPDLVLAETAYVLRSRYLVPREPLIDALLDLVARENVRCHPSHADAVRQALHLCRPSNRVSIQDALIWASAVSQEGSRVYTFDRRFPQDGIAVVNPAALVDGDGEAPRSPHGTP